MAPGPKLRGDQSSSGAADPRPRERSRHARRHRQSGGARAGRTELSLIGRSEELIQRLTSDIPLGHLGQLDDIARVVSFLASPEIGGISGQVNEANGGRN